MKCREPASNCEAVTCSNFMQRHCTLTSRGRCRCLELQFPESMDRNILHLTVQRSVTYFQCPNGAACSFAFHEGGPADLITYAPTMSMSRSVTQSQIEQRCRHRPKQMRRSQASSQMEKRSKVSSQAEKRRGARSQAE